MNPPQTLPQLRETVHSDLPIFFTQQLDPVANQMAAFTVKDPADEPAFYAHWAKIMADDTLTRRTILVDGAIAGYVICHAWFGSPEVTYWLGRDFWGRGVATAALQQLLNEVTKRPIFAHIAQDNLASLHVLQKCGFVIIGEDKGFAAARGTEIAEYILKHA